MTMFDLMTLIVLPVGALIFLGLFMLMRGAWWWSLVSGLLWIMFGITCISSPLIFSFQRELSVVWIVIGIGTFFMPAWYKRRDQKTMAEKDEEEDTWATTSKKKESKSE